MKTAAVICEFNPFHNGHKYIIDTIKKNFADRVLCIMSGSFVQRGDAAICDKYQRTEAALNGGADIVVELPTVFATANAQSFAKGAVDIAKAMGVDMLCFGVQDADIDTIKDVAYAFDDEGFKLCIKEHIKNGMYYPKAIELATKSFLTNKHSEALSDPNFTLAVEYVKALKNSDISPVAIKRTGTSHDSDSAFGNIASASLIRRMIRENQNYSKYTCMDVKNPAFLDNIESAVMYRLKTMTKEEFERLPDVSEGLQNRIYDCVRKYNSLNELLEALKTKRYIMARLRRIIICAMLNITKDDVNTNAKYVRVLGMNDYGAKLLNKCKLPVVAKTASDVRKLDDEAKRMFDIDVRASEVFSLISGDNSINDYTAKLIKI